MQIRVIDNYSEICVVHVPFVMLPERKVRGVEILDKERK